MQREFPGLSHLANSVGGVRSWSRVGFRSLFGEARGPWTIRCSREKFFECFASTLMFNERGISTSQNRASP